MAIHFYTESINFTLKKKEKRRLWLKQLATKHKKVCGNLSYIFVSDYYLMNINKIHIKHNYYTDIITFSYNTKSRIKGDIFISIDRVLENARRHHCKFEEELNRVMAHGVLHLIGFNDKTDAEQKEMTKQEDEALELFNKLS